VANLRNFLLRDFDWLRRNLWQIKVGIEYWLDYFKETFHISLCISWNLTCLDVCKMYSYKFKLIQGLAGRLKWILTRNFKMVLPLLFSYCYWRMWAWFHGPGYPPKYNKRMKRSCLKLNQKRLFLADTVIFKAVLLPKKWHVVMPHLSLIPKVIF
jgi:hypothetical protein